MLRGAALPAPTHCGIKCSNCADDPIDLGVREDEHTEAENEVCSSPDADGFSDEREQPQTQDAPQSPNCR